MIMTDDDVMFRDRILADLRWHWGEAYEITAEGLIWQAVRRDDRAVLMASGPAGLRELIVADYTAHPVAR